MTSMAEYKVLLTTSGLGSRLGNLTKFTNKSLVRIGDKPVISHIITLNSLLLWDTTDPM
jgi:dTDP-glucose pyrophosphorylase